MRWLRQLYTVCMLYGAIACVTIMALPSYAYAELIDIATMPGIRVTDLSYDTSADLNDEDDTFSNNVIEELYTNPLAPNGSYTDDMVVIFPRVIWDTTNSQFLKEYHLAQNSRSYEGLVDPLAYISLDMYENPIPQNARITFDGFQSYFGFMLYESGGDFSLHSNDLRTNADHVTLWASSSRYPNNAVRCNYNSNEGFYTVPIQARYLYIAFRLHRTFDGEVFTNSYTKNLIRIYYGAPIHVYWQVIDDDTVQQTESLKDTTGSDSIVPDVTQDYTEGVNDLPISEFIGNIEETLGQSLTSQQQDTTMLWPAVSFMGFTMPAITFDPMATLPVVWQERIRLFVTFVFCTAFIRHIIAVFQAIFGIYEYGEMVFDDAEYDMGPQPRSWRRGSWNGRMDREIGF